MTADQGSGLSGPIVATDCLFCRIVREEVPAKVVYRSDNVVAFHDISPQAPIHLVVIPTKHLISLREATPADQAIIGELLCSMKEILKAANPNETDFRVLSNAGPLAGQTVYHLHFHLLAGRTFGWPPG